jgi:hypothetical protein
MRTVAIIGTVVVIVLGLYLVRSGEVPADMRLFGWLLLFIGVIGLLVTLALPSAGL